MTDFGIFDSVNTAYGPGYISAIRDDCYVVLLINWALAQGQSPTLYLQKDSIKYEVYITQFLSYYLNINNNLVGIGQSPELFLAQLLRPPMDQLEFRQFGLMEFILQDPLIGNSQTTLLLHFISSQKLLNCTKHPDLKKETRS